jgi:lipopolysaccharide export system ATP-binding protein
LSEPRLLRALALTKSYGRRVVVREVALEIRQGEVVGLLGPNGAGKTTTFYMVVGLARPDSGQVFLADEDITALPMYQRARAGIGYLPQEASIFRKLTAEENVLAILEICRALAAEPSFILLDEPFAGIDPLAVLDIQKIIAHLRDRGIGILITDHNVRETLKITDRAYILRDGNVFRSGTPLELASDPEVRRVYLGEGFRLDGREA